MLSSSPAAVRTAHPVPRLLAGLAACSVLLAAATLLAELPAIRFDRLQPLGTGAGSSIEVDIVGRDLEDVTALRFDQPGLSAELLKPNRFKITVADTVPEGTYDVYLIGRFGVSNPRLFAVTRGLTDVIEKEPNNRPAEAQEIPLNAAINGASDSNGQDCFRFSLKQNERVTIDCQAFKLDSQLDANLVLSAASGQILANNGDYHGRDPFIDFTAPADGEYTLTVNDLSYRGGFPYRLLVTTRPQVENVFPRAVRAGESVELLALGRNLQAAGTGSVSALKIEDLPLDEFRFQLQVPADLATAGRYTFLEHPTDHSVLPTAATCTVDGYQVRVPIGDVGALHPATLLVTESPVTVEQEPNNDKAHPQTVSLPAVVSGRFDAPRDADWFVIEPPENGSYTFEVYSERFGGRADPYLVVFDDKDNQVSEFDDFGPRVNAFDGHLRDPYGTIGLQAKRPYKVLVQDRYSRGGARFQYVLMVRPAQPDFHVAAIHNENPGPGGTSLFKGGATYLDLVVNQRDGYNEPITVTAEGLPPGVHAAPTVINNNSRGTFVLWSDADAPNFAGPIRLVATGRRGEQELRREVRPYTRVWPETQLNSSRPMRELNIAVLEPAPYALQFSASEISVEAGKKLDIKLQATRLWPDFKDKITVIPLAFPGQFKMNQVDISPGAATVDVSIEVQPNTRPGPYTLTVLGQAQVPFNKDPQATTKPNTLVSTPSRPLTITVLPAPAK